MAIHQSVRPKGHTCDSPGRSPGFPKKSHASPKGAKWIVGVE
jgi:hypothetical protein